jgi:hypothetical protein
MVGQWVGVIGSQEEKAMSVAELRIGKRGNSKRRKKD